MERIRIEDSDIEYRRLDALQAHLPTLVFLHEGLGSTSAWHDFPDRLCDVTGCGAVVYSRAGYGGSDPVTLPRPLTYMHDEALLTLPRLLVALDIDDAVLVGHSDGGSIAVIHAAAPTSDRVRGLILEAPHVFVEQFGLDTIVGVRESFERGELRHRLARHHRDVDVAFWGWYDAWTDPGFLTWNLEKYVPMISKPILLIMGRDDRYGTAAQLDAIEAGANVSVSRVEPDDCGHAPHRDQPRIVLEAMKEFVAGLVGDEDRTLAADDRLSHPPR
ncbi:MAG: alpha/beta fold hydrolase [Acidimicrobiia bacterium]